MPNNNLYKNKLYNLKLEENVLNTKVNDVSSSREERNYAFKRLQAIRAEKKKIIFKLELERRLLKRGK